MGERWGTIRRVIATFRNIIFMTFDIFIVSTRNIPPYFNDTKVNEFFCFLLKSELVWYLESSHLYHCRGRSWSPAGVHLCLWSDSASISQELWAELQETLSQTKLRYRRHSRDSVYNWFSNRRKGDIKTHSEYLKIITFLKSCQNLQTPIIVILSARLHVDNGCLI